MPDAVVLAEAWRSGVRESVHRGHAVVLAADGSIARSWGDPQARVLPRSANKPAQAAAMVRAGLDLQDELLALAAASHSGEPFHVEGAHRILDSAGVPSADLRTPPDWPLDEKARIEYIAGGGVPTPFHMNCSGKHAAMLATCAVRDWSREDYLDPDHPLQRAAREEVAELAGEQPWAVAVDGCGAPLFGLSLSGLARLAASCVQAEPGSPPRAVADAMRAYPEWTAGTRRDAARLMRAHPGLLAKEGADGVYVVALDDGRAVALKIEDGADRARPVAMAGILRAIGLDSETLDELSSIPLMGGGRQVGEIVPGPR